MEQRRCDQDELHAHRNFAGPDKRLHPRRGLLVLDGERRMLLALVIACGINLFTDWNTDKMVRHIFVRQ